MFTATDILRFSGRDARNRIALAANRGIHPADPASRARMGWSGSACPSDRARPGSIVSSGRGPHLDVKPDRCCPRGIPIPGGWIRFLATHFSIGQCPGSHRRAGAGRVFARRGIVRAKETDNRTSASVALSALLAVAIVGLWQCGYSPHKVDPAIVFTRIPASSRGGPNKFDVLEGRVQGGKPGQRLVIYSLSGTWWVQPFAATPFTDIRPDSTWRASIHTGMQYAVLLVEPTYVAQSNLIRLPSKGGPILALAITKGTGYVPPPVLKPKTLHFSGYDWDARYLASPRGGRTNEYDPDNVWTDQRGFMHLRITRRNDDWICSEVQLKTSLGQGLYRFTVRDVSHIDPAAVMTLFTWDAEATDQHHRELDIEVSRWGDPKAKNAQYLIQPYYEPANVFRFEAPAGRLTYSFRWQPGEVSFRTVRGAGPGESSRLVSEQTFTSGVPSPGGESVYMNLYVFGKTRTPARTGSEVVIEKFEFLP
jgi:hypothetical protein